MAESHAEHKISAATNRENWIREFYQQGSEACRNYSRLTMKTRTLSQQVLVLSVAGLTAVIAKDSPTGRLFSAGGPLIALIAGIALLAFSVSLAFVDWHYQSAFTAIRNSLARIEQERGIANGGPWRAHLDERTHFKDHIASYGPFLLLGAVGCGATIFGISGLSSSEGGNEVHLTPFYFYWAMLPALVAAFWLLRISLRVDSDLQKELKNFVMAQNELAKRVKPTWMDKAALDLVTFVGSRKAYWFTSGALILASFSCANSNWAISGMSFNVLFLLILWGVFFGLMCWLAARKDMVFKLELEGCKPKCELEI